MNREDIIKTITKLSHSSGFYGRLLHQINSLPPAEYCECMERLEELAFKDEIDLILFGGRYDMKNNITLKVNTFNKDYFKDAFLRLGLEGSQKFNWQLALKQVHINEDFNESYCILEISSRTYCIPFEHITGTLKINGERIEIK